MEHEAFSPVPSRNPLALLSTVSASQAYSPPADVDDAVQEQETPKRTLEESEEPEGREKNPKRQKAVDRLLDMVEVLDPRGVAPVYLQLQVQRGEEQVTIPVPCLMPWNYALAARLLVSEHDATLEQDLSLASPNINFPMTAFAREFRQLAKHTGTSSSSRSHPLDPPPDLRRSLADYLAGSPDPQPLPEDLEAVLADKTTTSWWAIVSEGAGCETRQPRRTCKPAAEVIVVAEDDDHAGGH